MKRSYVSLVLGLVGLVVLSAPVAAGGGPSDSDPIDPPGGANPNLLEEVVLDALQGSWSLLWSVIL